MNRHEEPWDLVIGQVVAPFGIRGQVKVRPETDDPERFRLLKQVCLERAGGEQRMARIERVRVTLKGVTVHFEGVRDRAQAEALRGAWVKIRQSMALPLPEGSFYRHQLIGIHAYTEDGRDLGEITEVIQTPGNDVYVTPHAMIPALRQVVKQIDLEAKRMVVVLPPEDEDERGGEP
ncbi:MAG: ribosome maturation factor RimM [Armatimonadota bacterium]|jgi:16S rRNA processing protein RimM